MMLQHRSNGQNLEHVLIKRTTQRISLYAAGQELRNPICSNDKAFARAAVFCPEVEPARLGAGSALVGAGALALRADAASPRPVLPI